MIRIFEVGPRDGLQNEPKQLSLDQKLNLIDGLLRAGLDNIEIGAFVRADRIPQMADTDLLFADARLKRLAREHPAAKFWALVPNEKGLQRAIACGAKHIAVFGAATETFVRKNIGMSIDESIGVFAGVVKKAQQAGLEVRGYISVCWVCPYEGEVAPDAVARVVTQMLAMGIVQISLGDTVGRAHPDRTEELLRKLLTIAPAQQYAVHFHDTYGMALANVDRSVRMGISLIDSSVGGLGGCPYAPGASGNVATEDVYTLLEGYSRSGIPVQQLDIQQLLRTAALARKMTGRALSSRRIYSNAENAE